MPDTPAEPKSPPFFDGNDEPASASTPPQPEPAVKPTSKHSPRALRLAAELGFSQAEVEAATPEELNDAIYHQTIVVNRLQRQNFDTQQRMAAQDRPAAPQPPAKPPTDPEDELISQFTDEKYQPEIVQLAKLTTGMMKELRATKDQLKGSQEREQQRESLSRAEMMDAGFDALGDSYKAVVGDGSGLDMDQQGPEFKRRIAILQATGLDFSKPLTAKKLATAIKAAAELLYGSVMKPAASPTPASAPAAGSDPYAAAVGAGPVKPVPPKNPQNGRFVSPEEYGEAALARPTHRKGSKEAAGVERATKGVTELLKERGLLDDGGSGDAQPGDFLGGGS